MSKMKNHKFKNLPYNPEDLDDFLDDDYHYQKWKKKKKKRRQEQEGEYGDEWVDGIDE